MGGLKGGSKGASRRRAQGESQADGRVERGARTRRRIVDALLALVRQGALLPTAEEVAARAGVGTRTVFRHFDDMEALYLELTARIEREVAPLLEAPLPEGSPVERARALVARRVELFERIAPFKRSGDLVRWRSRVIEADHRRMVEVLRAELAAVLAPEIAPEAGGGFDAIELLTSFDAWDRLRRDGCQSGERTRAILEAAVVALVEAG